MRLWSLHPKYLDARGLVALWREALLAKAVLQGKTRGYRHHPQLARWQATPNPVASINAYLREVYAESVARGYRFDARKLGRKARVGRISVTRGQVAYEWEHLMAKLRRRDPNRYRANRAVKRPGVQGSFRIVMGTVEGWERIGVSGKRV
ncbi:MAG TPA: pyrimidine dimer DNA glycosylase/endonuclease V [Gemmatimonadales bacterium]|nr:pyrimidine dimer DNA glycosylase/endonuclease V [Gemmatimonadales bacterium]